MKFQINRDHFNSGLQQVLNIVSTRATMPILSNVLIEANDGHISLTTTNLDLGIRCKVKANVQEKGMITLPVRKLSSIVRAVPSLDIAVETYSNNQAKIASGSFMARIMGISGEDFPPLPDFADRHSFILGQDDLLSLLSSVSYAQSTDETRYIMNGVYMNFAGDELTLAATDGRRLSVISKSMEVTEDNAGHLILPAKTVAEVERLLGGGESVRIAFNDRQVAFEMSGSEGAAEKGLMDGIYLVSKVVEGNYPNYRQVIPKAQDQRVKLDREAFAKCVNRVALMTSDKNNLVRLRVSDNQLEVMGSTDIGESSDSVPIEYDGPEVQVAFNPNFIRDPLLALKPETVYFEFKDELSPGVIRTDDNFLCVIMPLRLS